MGKYGFSFSWKRATGITAAKRRISRATGVPLTRSGRRAKVGRLAGCMVSVLVLFGAGVAVAALL